MIFQMQKLVNCLLHRGADPVKSDEKGETSLHFAVKKKLKSVCITLLDYGAKADAEDTYGNTPYTLALQDRNDAIAALLIRTMKKQKHVNHHKFLVDLLF